MLSRRDFLRNSALGVAAAVGTGVAGNVSHAQGGAKGRVIILGFDGVEPSIAEAMIAKGELPNLAKLGQQGSYQRLESSNPPQSPTAWSSFITCKRPGNHGIFDFLRRTPSTYMPGLGFGSTSHTKLAADGTVIQPAQYANYRKGEPFWVVANREGVRCKLLNVPYAFPPDDLKDSLMLCGLEMPDVRGTQSTFFSLSEEFEKEESVAGGMRLPLVFDGDKATVNIRGTRNPANRKKFLGVPLTVKADRQNHTVTIKVQGQTQTVKEGAWSDWFEWKFNASEAYAIKAVSRFYASRSETRSGST